MTSSQHSVPLQPTIESYFEHIRELHVDESPSESDDDDDAPELERIEPTNVPVDIFNINIDIFNININIPPQLVRQTNQILDYATYYRPIRINNLFQINEASTIVPLHEDICQPQDDGAFVPDITNSAQIVEYLV